MARSDGLAFDDDARKRGRIAVVIGVDEAGRGPLAGPVVVAAVSLPKVPSKLLRQVRDSKLMTPKSRTRLFGVIRSQAIAISVAWEHPRGIDRQNILRASLSAMARAARRAAAKSGIEPLLVLVDGPFRFPGDALAQRPIKGGDRKSLCIAAASVVAKVLRDRWMRRLAKRHPGYGFALHKGYGTRQHVRALKKLGPCKAHRLTYAPVSAQAVLR